jgi:hypothetical protein
MPPKIKPKKRITEEGYDDEGNFVRIFEDGTFEYAEDKEMPANQLGLVDYDGRPTVKRSLEFDSRHESSPIKKPKNLMEAMIEGDQKDTSKKEWEIIQDGDIIDMGIVAQPGGITTTMRPQYRWGFGRQDGVYRVILAMNSIIKVKKIYFSDIFFKNVLVLF